MEAAMTEAQDKYDFRVRWQPFLLRSNIPPEGFPKPPNTPGNPRVNPRLKAAGEAVGIDFTGKSEVYPYTLRSHVLLEMTKDQPQLQDALAEKLFQAYFTDGSSLDEKSLLGIAQSLGLDKGKVQSALRSEATLEEAHSEARTWAQRGVSGVPAFYMNGQKTFSGAQDPETFTRIFEIVAEKFPHNETSQQQARV